MRCSRNEIASLAYKAGLGTGLDPGTAQDAAAAVVQLCVGGHEGLAILLARLEDLDGMRRDVARADLLLDDEQPADLFVAALVSCRADKQQGSGPVSVSDGSFAAASMLAHKIYVPATAASRERGAGAGTTDND